MAAIIISVLFLDAILLLDVIVTGTVRGARRNIWNNVGFFSARAERNSRYFVGVRSIERSLVSNAFLNKLCRSVSLENKLRARFFLFVFALSVTEIQV